MGSSERKIRDITSKLRKKENNNKKMAFYIYEQPAFSMEHFHPGFYQPLRSVSRPRHWNLLENLFEQEVNPCQSSQCCCASKSMKKSTSSTSEEGKMEVEGNKTNKEIKDMEPVTKTFSKQFMSKVACQETMEKVEIKVQFGGHTFQVENVDVQVVNGDILIVKAEDDEEKFERKFKLPSNILVEKIESKYDTKEDDTQTLMISIPKNVKVVQVPIAMDE